MVVDKRMSFCWPLNTVRVLGGVVVRPPLFKACCLASILLAACGRTPDSKPIVVPKSSGNRESMYGKSMDQAEALKQKVADYNESIEQTIEQGTKPDPPKKVPKTQPAPPK